MERKYMMYEGEDTNTIDLLDEQPTTERNGVKIIVPVKYSDRKAFFDKIKEQLCYFENVFFDVTFYGSTLKNDFKIFRSDDFQVSEITTDQNMHICLDNVYYPLDFAKLGIAPIDIPIGLRFGLSDGIFPTPNRETVRYTPEAKIIILNKIKKVADWMVEKYNERIKDTDDIYAIVDHYATNNKDIIFAERSVSINSLIPFASIKMKKPNLKGVRLLDLSHISYEIDKCFGEYEVKFELDYRSRMKEAKTYYAKALSYRDVANNNSRKIFIYKEKLTGLKKEWLKSLPDTSYSKLIRKQGYYSLFPRTKGSEECYYKILKLHKYPRRMWREMIKEYQYVQSLITSKFIDLDAMVIPQSWLDDRKQQRQSSGGSDTIARPRKLKGEVIGKEATNLGRWVEGQSCKFVPVTLTLEKIETKKQFIIYAHHDDAIKLDALFCFKGVYPKLRLVTFSTRELKTINTAEIHNLMSYDKFMEGKNKVFSRFVTAFLVSELRNEYNSTFNRPDIFEGISTSLHSKLNKLNSYYRANYQASCSSDVRMAMLDIARTHNLWDADIYDDYLDIKKLLKRLTFINPIMKYMASSYGIPEAINILKDLFKFYKYRMDFSVYGIKLNEEVPSDEESDKTLTDSEVEELTNEITSE